MKNYNSTISIGIFGIIHTNNILYYFLYIFNKYQLLFSINNYNNNQDEDKDNLRCIEINKNINLDSILNLKY